MSEHFEIGDLVVHERYPNEVAEVIGVSRIIASFHLRYDDDSMIVAFTGALTHYRPTPEQVAHEKALEATDSVQVLLAEMCGSNVCWSYGTLSCIYAAVHAAVLDVMADE